MVKLLALKASGPEIGSPEAVETPLGCGGSPVIPALEAGDRGSPIPASRLAILATFVNSAFDLGDPDSVNKVGKASSTVGLHMHAYTCTCATHTSTTCAWKKSTCKI